MSKSTRIPRASLAVSLLSDDDYVEMMSTQEGCMAFALFVALVLEAKAQANGGVFKKAGAVLCKQIKWESRLFKCALEYLLNFEGCWVVKNGDTGIEIRNFEKWNSGWGGSRNSAKRPGEKNQDNSSGNLDNSSGDQDAQLGTDSDSDSDSDIDSGKKEKSAPVSSADVEQVYQAYPLKAGKLKALPAIKSAIKEIRARGEPDAVGWLIQRVQAYAESPKGLSKKFCGHPQGWFNRGHYDDDEAAWQSGDDTSARGTTPESSESVLNRISKLGKEPA